MAKSEETKSRISGVFNKKTNNLIFILFTFSLPLLYFFFMHVPQQEKEIDARNLRLVRDFSKHLSDKFIALDNIINNAATEAFLPKGPKVVNKEQHIKNILKLIPDLHFINASFSNIDTADINKLYLNKELHSFKNGNGSSVFRELRKAGNSYNLFIKYKGVFRTPGLNSVEINARMDLTKIVSPVVSRGLFDDVLLAQNNGQIIYQRDSKLFKATLIDSILEINSNKSFSHNNIRRGFMGKSRFAEQDFVVYSQPLSLPVMEIGDARSADSSHRKIEILDEKNNLILHAIVLQPNYIQESRSISYNIVILFSIVILILGLSLPIIKLWQIGAQGRYRITDVIFLAISLLLLMGLISFTLIDYNFYNSLIEELDDQLESFSTQLQENIYKDIDKASKQLSLLNTQLIKEVDIEYKKLKQQQLLPKINQSKKKNITDSLRFRTKMIRDESINDFLLEDVNFSMIFWIDTLGQQVGKWTKKDFLTPPVIVKGREYYLNIINNKPWRFFSDNNDTNKENSQLFWFQPITSKTTGENFATLSLPFSDKINQKDIAVSGIDITPQSLFNPLLPKGFGFVIMDKAGDVLFHSNKNHNLQENFIVECKSDKNLRAAVYSKTAQHFNLNYEGKQIRSYVRPLTGTPWYIIVSREKEILRTANLEILTIVFVFYLLLVVSHIFLLVIIYYIRSRKEIDRKLPQWITPQAGNITLYFRFSIIYFVLFVILVLYAYFCSIFEAHIFIVLIAPFYITLSSFFALSSKGDGVRERFLSSIKKHRTYSVSLLIIIITSFFIIQTGMELGWLYGIAHIFLLLASSIVLFRAADAKVLDEYENINQADDDFVENNSISALDKIQVLVNRLSFRAWFITAAVFYLSIIAIVPSFSLFHVIGKYEAELFLKNTQYALAKDFSARQQSYKQASSDTDENINKFFRETTIKEINKSEEIPGSEKLSVGIFSDLFYKSYGWVRLSFNKSSINSKSFFNDSSSDGTWRVFKTIAGYSYFEYLNGENSFILVKSRLLELENFISLKDLSVFLLVIILFLLLFSKILHHITIFEFGRLKLVKNPKTLEEILDFKELYDQRILLLSPPLAGKSAELKNLENTRVLNMVDASEKEDRLDEFLKGDMSQVIVIDQLEFALLRPEYRLPMLTFLEQLLKDARNKVILVSTIDPTYHLDKLVPPIEENSSQNDNQLIILRWSGIIAKFEKLYLNHQIDENLTAELTRAFKSLIGCTETGQVSAENNFKKRLSSVFRNEINSSKHLQNVGFEIIGHAEFQNFSQESLIHEITNRAFPYYKVLWSTCSTEEKLVLIQLCEDGVVTLKKLGIIRRLLRRGVVKIKSYPKPLNESFKRFVLSVYKAEDLVAETQGNSWASTRIPLVLGILAFVVFIAITQKSYISDSLTIISSMAALIPTILRLSTTIFSASKGVQKE